MKTNKVKRRTQEFKQSLYNRAETILNIVYHLGNGIMLKEQLITLTELLDINKSNIPNRIEELIEEGFLNKKQVLDSKKYAIYLTRYPIGKIEKKPSNKVNGVAPTKEKILSSLFRTEYIIETIIPVISKRPLTIELIKNTLYQSSNTILLNKNHGFVAYENLLNCRKLKDMNFTETFYQDKNIAEYEKLARFKKDNQKPENKLLKVKQDVEKTKTKDIETKTIKKEEEKYFDLTNMLNRNFNIRGLNYNNTTGQLKVVIDYFDINNPDIGKIYSNLGYIYNMFIRYFNGILTDEGYYLGLELIANVYTTEKVRANELRGQADRKIMEFSTGGYKKYRKGANALINAKVPEMFLDRIKVEYKLFDFDSKYSIKVK